MESPPPPPAPSPASSVDSGGRRASSSPGPMPLATYPSPPLSASHSDLSAFLSSPQHAQFTFSLPVPVPVPFPMAQHPHQPLMYATAAAPAASPALIDSSAMTIAAAAAAAAAASGHGWPGTHAHPPQVVPIPLSPMDLASYQAAVQHAPQQPLLISPNHLQGHSPAPESCVTGNVLGPTAPAATTSSTSDLNHPSSPTRTAASSSSQADRAQSLDPACSSSNPSTKRKPVIAMPELPSALEKRCKGGPGKKRKGISDEERMARQQDRVARNRIAAQESRNKKRAYVETLEAAAADLQEANAQLADDNERLRKRVKVLEEDNAGLAKKLDWVMAQMAKVSGVQVPDELMGAAASQHVPEPVPDAQQPVEQPLASPVPTSPSPSSDLITMSLADLTALIADGTAASASLQVPSMFDFAALFTAPTPAPMSSGQLQAQPALSSPASVSPSPSSSSSLSFTTSSSASLSTSPSSSSGSLPSASSTPTPGFPGPAAAGKLPTVSSTGGNSQQRRPRGARVFEAPPARSHKTTMATRATLPTRTTTWTTTLVVSKAQQQQVAHLLPAWDSHWTLALAAMLKLMHWTLALATTWMRTCSSLSLFDVLVGELTKSGHVGDEVARAIVAGVLQMDASATGVKTVVVQVPSALVDKLLGARRKVEGDRALAKRWGVYKKRPP